MAAAAYDDPETRRRIVSVRALSATAVVAGALLAVVTIVGWVLLNRHYLAEEDKLDRYPGVIVSTRAGDGDTGPGLVRVRFTVDGAPIVFPVAVGEVERWPPERSVTGLVDPSPPHHVSLLGQRYRPESVDAWAVFLGIVGLTLLVSGWKGVLRTQRQRHCAEGSPWRSLQGSVMAVEAGDTKKLYAYFPDFAPEVVWALPNATTSGQFQAEVAGDRDGIVFRRAISPKLVLAKPQPLGSPRPVRIVADARHGSKVALRVHGNDVSIYEIDNDAVAKLVSGSDHDGTAMLRPGPSPVAVFVIGTDELRTFAFLLSAEEARKRWPELAPRDDVKRRDP